MHFWTFAGQLFHVGWNCKLLLSLLTGEVRFKETRVGAKMTEGDL